MDCIFCRIVKGEVGNKVYEDSLFIAVMDVNPISRGHMLVVPKEHAEQLTDLSDAYLGGALLVIKQIVSKVGTIDQYNILQNNGHLQSVKHVHFHIIPWNAEDEEGLLVNWTRSRVSAEEIRLLGDSIKQTFQDK
ncbi:hypothetical protein NEHOM01_1143 [Nematocida homosporus]|uniref:uncharacterized protein n=1 Tax=Nematocida homosporus TaxID=1912981 RepID=UPI00221E857F|nr:uncharacterized protein NEHOM01_1143 [Nematocida homosporus]KAI5185893.1 hypothetical protein NEHOM01_1143 [Nematocida homosporus]